MDAQSLLQANKFVSDFDVIATTTPELKPELIYREYSYVGESLTQKNTGTSLSHDLGQNELLYHANAFSASRDTLWIISKQKEKKKRSETGGATFTHRVPCDHGYWY